MSSKSKEATILQLFRYLVTATEPTIHLTIFLFLTHAAKYRSPSINMPYPRPPSSTYPAALLLALKSTIFFDKKLLGLSFKRLLRR